MDSATVVSPSANKDYYKKNKCFDRSMELIAFLGNYDRQTGGGDRTTEQEPDMKGHREVTLPIIYKVHRKAFSKHSYKYLF